MKDILNDLDRWLEGGKPVTNLPTPELACVYSRTSLIPDHRDGVFRGPLHCGACPGFIPGGAGPNI